MVKSKKSKFSFFRNFGWKLLILSLLISGGAAYLMSESFYPYDFEILETDMPFYQTAFNDSLEYEFTIKNHHDIIKATGTDCEFKISNITLEFQKIKSDMLVKEIKHNYSGGKEVLFDRIHRYKVEK